MEYDCIVIGSGISGSVVARFVAEQLNKKVLIIERRTHVGGNMFDYTDANGVLVHRYGPHLFHTNDIELVRYMERFTAWREYKVKCMVFMEGKFTPTPFNFQTINDYYNSAEEAQDLKNRLVNSFNARPSASIVELLKNNDPVIRQFAEFLFEKDYRLYTAKQWGIPASEIDSSVLDRVPIRFSYETNRFDDTYQILPKTSYTNFFNSLLNHPNITLRIGENGLDSVSVDSLKQCMRWKGEEITIPVVYTGAIDELFGFRFGQLPYRSLHIETKTINSGDFQPAPIIAYPQDPDYIRITDYNKLMETPPKDVTTIGIEYSIPAVPGENELYYIISTEASKQVFAKYKAAAAQIGKLFLCGRLAEYKYYDMDEALASALKMGETLEKYLY